MVLFVCTAAYLLSYLAASRGMYILSGLVLIGTAAGTAFYDYRKSGRLICPAVLFSLSWIGRSGISCLKLSRLQVPWETETWLCIYLTYAVFRIVYMWSAKLFENKKCHNNNGVISAADTGSDNVSGGLLAVMCVIALVSTGSFIAEALILGYIPLFLMDTPHAYSYFHVSGLHYFTVRCKEGTFSGGAFRQRAFKSGTFKSGTSKERYFKERTCAAFTLYFCRHYSSGSAGFEIPALFRADACRGCISDPAGREHFHIL